MECGLDKYWQTKYWPRPKHREDKKSKSVQLREQLGVFFLLLIGIAVSVVTLVMECVFARER